MELGGRAGHRTVAADSLVTLVSMVRMQLAGPC